MQKRVPLQRPRSTLARLDLNLLVALDALLAERSVTRAARRVGLSQPAMSNALARLRVAFGDPLLVRARGEMVPTPRALALGRVTASALRDLEAAMEADGTFDPASARRTFTLAASDYVGLVLLAPLVRSLASRAPGITLRVVGLQPDLSLAELEAGAIDLTLGVFKSAPRSLHRVALFEDRLVTVMRRGHPAAGRPLRARDLAALAQVQIAPQGETAGRIDLELAEHGLARHVALAAPHFLLALTVAGTDLACSIPERLADALAPLADLVTTPLPIAKQTISVAAYWHPRAHHDPGHAWLRAQLVEHAKIGKKKR